MMREHQEERPGDGVRNRLLVLLVEYQGRRQQAVDRGQETPHLAGLLLQKYSYGLADAARVLREHGRPVDLISDVDAAVASIDPEWAAHAQQRWAAEPADLATGA